MRISSTFFPSYEQPSKTKGESPKLLYLYYYSFFQYWLLERKYNNVEDVEDMDIFHKQLLMVKIWNDDCGFSTLVLLSTKNFFQNTSTTSTSSTRDVFQENSFWKSNLNGEWKHPQMMISRFLHEFCFLLIIGLFHVEGNHPQHPPSSTYFQFFHENLVIPPPPYF